MKASLPEVNKFTGNCFRMVRIVLKITFLEIKISRQTLDSLSVQTTRSKKHRAYTQPSLPHEWTITYMINCDSTDSDCHIKEWYKTSWRVRDNKLPNFDCVHGTDVSEEILRCINNKIYSVSGINSDCYIKEWYKKDWRVTENRLPDLDCVCVTDVSEEI